MPEIDFQPERRSIEDLFVSADYYLIPRFQRPYSWEVSNLDDFWRDVVYDNDIGYFIGPMVAWKEAKSPVQRIVDGQQRLTTIALMFAVLRDELRMLGESTLAQGIQRYLEKADRNNEQKFTLQTEASAPYLGRSVFADPPDRTVQPSTEEEIALFKALEDITRRVKEELFHRQDARGWLLALRDKLLGLRVIWIEHGNEDDAYVIFETLNSRGKDLEVVDLLKNHLLNKLRGTGNAAADSNRVKWEQMRRELEAGDARKRLDPNRFILHWWLSQEDYVGERKLFPAIKAKVKSRPLAKLRLDSLRRDARLYRAAVEPSSRQWPMEELAAKSALEALAIFGIVQPAPLLLSLMRARTDSLKLNAGQFNRTLQVVERFHFQHTIVSQLRSSGGVSEMYARAARNLSAAGADQQARAEALKELRDKLISRRPEREQFTLAFQERFFFTSAQSRDSKLVRYVLAALLRHSSPSTRVDGLTIEHIMPQRSIAEGVNSDIVGNIGNLILVDESLNQKLKDKPFAEKKQILETAGKAYDIGGVFDRESWTTTDVNARTQLLAERAYDSVWKLPL